MTKKLSTTLLVTFICVLPIVSQNISFQYNAQTVSNLVIPADSADAIYTLTAILPIDNIEYTYWSVGGGIEVVDSTQTEITIRCKSGDSYATKYSKYAYGFITIHAKKVEEDVSEECAACEVQDCNPYYKGSISIYKTFNWSGNKIVGDNCISAGDSVTYSVAPWISLLYYSSNEYYWNIPEELRASDLYYSADGSSVTFVASEEIEGQTISVEIGKYNLDSGQDALTLTMGRDVDIPQIDGMVDDSYYCLPFETDTFTLTINNANDDVLYEWDVLSWTISEQNSNGSETVIVADKNAQTIFLTATNACSEKSYYYNINRSLSENYDITTSNDDPYCLKAGSYQQFYIDEVPAGTQMTWIVEGDGWNISETESVKARPQITVGTATGIVTAYCTKCNIPIVTDTFFVAPNTIGSISGESCISQGASDTLTYSIDAVEGADYYEWIYPEKWELISDSTDNEISLVSDGISVDTIKVRAIGCSSTDWSCILPQMTYNAPLGFEYNCVNVNQSGYTTFTVLEDESVQDDVLYIWTFPSELGVIKSYNDSKRKSVSVYCTGKKGEFEISVKAQNSCGTSEAYSETIEVADNFSLTAYIASRYGRVIETDIEYIEGVTNFDWYVAGILFYSGPETQINFRASDEDFGDYFYSGSAYVIATYDGGCTEMQTIEWDDSSTAELIEKSLDVADNNLKTLSITSISSSYIKIYPNPTDGIINVDIANSVDIINGKLCVTDVSGKIVELRTVSNNNISIDLSEHPSGTYILSLIADKKVLTQKIIKR